MSLINNMLLDLDARQVPANDQSLSLNKKIAADLQPVSAGHKVNPRQFKNSLLLASLILIISGLYFSQAPTLTTENSTQQAILHTPLTIKQPRPFTAAASTSMPEKMNSINPAISVSQQIDNIPVAATIAHISTSIVTPTKKITPATQTFSIIKKQSTPMAPTKNIIAVTLPTSQSPQLGSNDIITQIKQPVTVTADEKAHRSYASALRFIKSGRQEESLVMLQKTLDFNINHLKARELLSGIYVQQYRWQEAEQVLSRGVDLNPGHPQFNHLLARLKIEQNQDNVAITILEQQNLLGNMMPDSSALLGLLYQRQGLHDNASKHYSDALKSQPEKGQWWLGLAISLDAQQQWNAAAKAYQQAIASKKLAPQLLSYANQRHQALSRSQILH